MATYSFTTGNDTLNGGATADTFIVEFDRYAWDSIPAGYTASATYQDGLGFISPNAGLTGPVNGTATDAQINAGDSINGGGGNDALWAGGASMSTAPMYTKDFDFRPVSITSIEELWFSYMIMPMPGSARFNSNQFGAGMSNNMTVRGAWGGADIIVDLVPGSTNFSAAAWTFSNPVSTGASNPVDPTGYRASMVVNGVTWYNIPSGISAYNWGPYIYKTYNVEVGYGVAGDDMGGDFFHEDRVILNGSTGADTITGSVMYDIISAGDGDDVVNAGHGALDLQGGDDVDGGSGTDTLVFTKAFADYAVSTAGSVVTISEISGANPTTFAYTAEYNSVSAKNFEFFQFSDGTKTAAQLLGDTTPPAAPSVATWDNTTAPVMNGTEPMWRVSGTAEANSTVQLYSTVLNADGSVASRTQLTSYYQDTPTTILPGANYVTADGSGNWSFQTNFDKHTLRSVSATATDLAGNISAYSLVSIEGSDHSDTYSLTSPTALAGISKLDGYLQDAGVGDILSYTNASVTAADVDFVKVKGFEAVKLAGTGTVTLGANALTTGINRVITGTGSTSVTDSNAHTLTVDAALFGAAATLTLSGAANFVATGGVNNDTITASTATAAASLSGAGGADTLTGGSGADTLDGGAGVDRLVGGNGNDTYIVDAADVIVEAAGQGTDTVLSSVTHTLAANVENLTLTGSGAINGTGNTLANLIMGNSGNNTLNGGSGTDTVSYANATAGVTISLALAGAQNNNAAGVGTDTLSAFENLTGSSFGDTLTGSSAANVINGGAGNDTIVGFAGADTVDGGADTDTITLTATSTNLNSATDARIVNVEAVSAATAAAAVTLNLGNQTEGFTLTGGGFNDTITGGGAADSISGGNGNDTIEGRLGSDTLTGGGGIDTFVFKSALGAGNIDTITDFVVGSDKIGLGTTIFTAIGATLDATELRIGAVAADANDFIIYNSATGALFYDADGSGAGAQQQFASLTTGLAITTTQFSMV